MAVPAMYLAHGRDAHGHGGKCTEAQGVKPLTIQQIRQATNGKALAALPKDAPLVKSISSDSTRIDPFSLFIAIKGPNKNGHDFLPDVASAGAVAALVQEPPRH